MFVRTSFLIVAVATAVLAGCTSAPPGPVAAPADTIYHGGPIVTVDDAKPTAEAVAVRGGKIVAVGSRAEVMALKGSATAVVDLKGRTLVPGLIDGHAHIAQFGTQAIGANLLAAPDGAVETIDDLIAEMKKALATQDQSLTGWVFGMGYDDAILGRHPTSEDLDKVSTTVPVTVIHISGHFSAVNSVGLKKIGYTAATPDPEGGVIRRRPGSKEPNGVMEEVAHFAYAVEAVAPKSPAASDLFLKKGLDLAKSYGYTTANEGMTFPPQYANFIDSARRGLIDIDVIGYVPYASRDILDKNGVGTTYNERFRLGGMKIALDGSPQGRTAWRASPCKLAPDGQAPDYRAYPAIPDTKVLEGLFDEAYRKKWPTHVHANGDAAIDQMIAAFKPVHAKYGPGDRRFTLIHGQFIRKDQMDALKEVQVIPSLFPMHTFYCGDWYEKIIGPELAAQISPMRYAIDKGMKPTSHTDVPVALPNLMQVMWATVNRTSRSGKVIGPNERLTPLEALKAITIWGAYEQFEEDRKGSITAGKLADLVILSDNPLAIDPMKINKIVVLETIKHGKSVYTRKAQP